MWIIAGLVIGSIIFVSGYTLLSHWVVSNEINQAHSSFSSLRTTILSVCSIGTDMQEIKTLVFPRVVRNISVYDKVNSVIGTGNSLCIEIEDQGLFCEDLNREPNTCRIPLTMDTISFDRKDSLFYIVQKAMGRTRASQIEFTVTKSSRDSVTISWTERLVE